jgi:hypothetical protein
VVKKNQGENEQTLKNLRRFQNAQLGEGQSEENKDSPSTTTTPGTLQKEQGPQPSTSKGLTVSNVDRNEKNARNAMHPSDLVFEADDLKLTIIGAEHKQERKFRLTDHMWHLLLTPTTQTKKMPLLSDILNFLFIAFSFMLKHIKKFYNPKVSKSTLLLCVEAVN